MKTGCVDYPGIFYRLLLRMHPASFRERFGEEMFWIFEEERERGATVRLLLDGLRSLVHQRWRVERPAAPAVVGFSTLDTALDIPPRRFVEAGLTASLLLAAFVFLLGQGSRTLGLPCLPGTPHPAPRLLEAPSRIRALPESRPDRAGRADATQINSAVAGAVRIARAEEMSRASALAYCPQQ